MGMVPAIFHIGISLDGCFNAGHELEEAIIPTSVEAMRQLDDASVTFAHWCNNLPGEQWEVLCPGDEIPTVTECWPKGPVVDSSRCNWLQAVHSNGLGSGIRDFLREKKPAGVEAITLSVSVIDHKGRDETVKIGKRRVHVSILVRQILRGLRESGVTVDSLWVRIVMCYALLMGQAVFDTFKPHFPNLIISYSSGMGEVNVGTVPYSHRRFYQGYAATQHLSDDVFELRANVLFVRSWLRVCARAGSALGDMSVLGLHEGLTADAEDQLGMIRRAVIDARARHPTQAGERLLAALGDKLPADRVQRELDRVDLAFGRPGVLSQLRDWRSLGEVKLSLFGVTRSLALPRRLPDEPTGYDLVFALATYSLGQGEAEDRSGGKQQLFWRAYRSCCVSLELEPKDPRELLLEGRMAVVRWTGDQELRKSVSVVLEQIRENGGADESESWQLIVLGALVHVWKEREKLESLLVHSFDAKDGQEGG
jgi:hypothetical protein